MKKWLVCMLFASIVLTQTPWSFAQSHDRQLSKDPQLTKKLKLTVEMAVSVAMDVDPWLNGSRHRETALDREALSAFALPDPMINVVAANFPVDGFDIHQEPMTQLMVSVSQSFPRGSSRYLSRRQKQELAKQEPWLRVDRRAKVKATVTLLWLEAFKAQESIRLIEDDRALFEHLVDATLISYSSAMSSTIGASAMGGRTRQQDVIRAQLELTRLDDRLTVLRQQQETARQRLSEWIGDPAAWPLASVLPEPLASKQQFWHQLASQNAVQHSAQNEIFFYEHIKQHPVLQAFDQRLRAMETGVTLARQQFKPAWRVTAQYGYRDDDPLGRDRADLFSVGVGLELPLTGYRQDNAVRSAAHQVAALKSEKQLMLRKMLAELRGALAQFQHLNERAERYDQQLLPQMAEQAEAALAAYNNDDGNFAEAVRARIAELNAKIDALGISVEQQQNLANLLYLTSDEQLCDEQSCRDPSNATTEKHGE
ncbi:MAG: TolC family protein [Gammaproteobacteria bacterium]